MINNKKTGAHARYSPPHKKKMQNSSKTKGQQSPNTVLVSETVDPYEDLQNMDLATQQRLSYSQMLIKGMKMGTGNGNPGFVGGKAQVLNAQLFNMSIAFGEIAIKPVTNSTSLELAFRQIALLLFENAGFEKESANIFLSRFFAGIMNITGQNLKDTGMARAELAFHEAWNIMYFGEGETQAVDDATRQSVAEQNRLMIEALLRAARDNAEIMRQRAEMEAEEAERWRKVMLIAARIARGDNVPLKDRQFLLENSPGMYMLANSTRAQNENPKDHKSLLSNDSSSQQAAENSVTAGGNQGYASADAYSAPAQSSPAEK